VQESVKIEGLEEVKQFFQELNTKIEHSRGLYAEAANVVKNAVEDSFASESDYYGRPWQPLKPETIKRKGSSKILYEEGNLQDSLYSRSTPFGAEIGISATSRGYYYPMVQQFGNKKGTLPARPFFPIDESGNVLEGMEKEIMEAISDGLDALIG